MRVRRQLMDLTLEIIRRDGLADYDIARMCGTSRPRGSNLVHGHIERFNSETLIDILARVGVELELRVVRQRPYRRWHIPRHPTRW
jgi:predicted XRE-type DNA-binding protein